MYQTKKISVSLSAASQVRGFQLSNIATSMFIITHCKKGEAAGKTQTCMYGSLHTVLISHTHTHLLPSSTVALETLKSMVQENKVPSFLAVTRLVRALGSCGDLAGIQEVETLVDGLGTGFDLSNALFINRALAHIKK